MPDDRIPEPAPDRLAAHIGIADDIMLAVAELRSDLYARPVAPRPWQPDTQLAEAMAVIDAHRARRLERRLANVPVECERRQGPDRRSNR